MKRIKFILVSLFLAVFAFSSCSDDDESSRTNFTPAEHKAEIRTILNDVITQVKPEDHKDLLQVIAHFVSISEGLEVLPQTDAQITSLLSATKAVFEKNDFDKMTRAATNMVSLSMLNGIHNYDEATKTWKKTESQKGLEINFTFNGKPASLKLTPSEKTHISSLNMKTPDDQIALDIVIPEKVNAVITLDKTTLLEMKGEFDINESLSVGKIKLELNANNYVAKLKLDATPSHAELDLTAKIKGKEILDLDLEVNGENMTVAQEIVNALQKDSDLELVKLFHNAKAELTIGDAIKLKGECSNFTKVLEPLFREHGEYSRENMLKDINDFIAAYNTYCKVDMYYTDGDNKIASLSFKLLDDGEHPELEIYIDFVVDGSSEPIFEFFDEEFYGPLSETVGKLAAAYQEILKDYMGE